MYVDRTFILPEKDMLALIFTTVGRKDLLPFHVFKLSLSLKVLQCFHELKLAELTFQKLNDNSAMATHNISLKNAKLVAFLVKKKRENFN